MVTIGDAVQGTVLFLKDLRGVDELGFCTVHTVSGKLSDVSFTKSIS